MYVIVELPNGEICSYPENSIFEMFGGMICVRAGESNHSYGIHASWRRATMVNNKKDEVTNEE